MRNSIEFDACHADLPGVGQGTVEKIDAFFAGFTGGPPLQSAADDEHAYLEQSDKDVVVELLRAGSVTMEQVMKYRKDITTADL